MGSLTTVGVHGGSTVARLATSYPVCGTIRSTQRECFHENRIRLAISRASNHVRILYKFHFQVIVSMYFREGAFPSSNWVPVRVLGVGTIVMNVPSCRNLLLLSQGVRLGDGKNIVMFLSVCLLCGEIARCINTERGFMLFYFAATIHVLLQGLSSNLNFVRCEHGVACFFGFGDPYFYVNPLSDCKFHIRNVFSVASVGGSVGINGTNVASEDSGERRTIVVRFGVTYTNFGGHLMLLQDFANSGVVRRAVHRQAPQNRVVHFLRDIREFFQDRQFRDIRTGFA